MLIEKIAICRKKYDAHVKNLIAKRCSKLNQSDYSDRALRDEKAQRPPSTKSLAKAIVTMVFRRYDVTLTISLQLSLRVATPLVARQRIVSIAISYNRNHLFKIERLRFFTVLMEESVCLLCMC